MYFRGNFDALCCVGRGRTKETIFAVERSEAVHYIGHAERDKRHCARRSRSLSCPSGSVHRVPFLLPLDTFFRTDLTPAMINEGIRGMLLKLF